MTIADSLRVKNEDLRRTFDETWIPWANTLEAPTCAEIIGQERALRAIRMGLELKSEGYNIFITGLSGTGKMTTIKSLLEEMDHSSKVPDDLCYVHNFKHPDMPCMLSLPAGRGKSLRKDMEHLVEYLQGHVPEILESDTFKNRLDELLEKARVQEKDFIRKFEARVNQMNFALTQVQYGSIQRPELNPVIAGNPLNLAQLEQLVDQGKFSKEEFEKIRTTFKQLAMEMSDVGKQLKILQKELVQKQNLLIRETIRPFLEEVISDTRNRFASDRVNAYLDDVREDVLDRIDIFREKQEDKSNIFAALVTPKDSGNPFSPYAVNVLVDNSDLHGVPIIIETTPNYRNLFGTIEKSMDRSGATQTDFTRIKAGSLLQANGGYLVVNANDALLEPEVWKNIKRAMKFHRVSIQTFDPFFLFSSVYMKPEDIAIDVKVVMIGDKEIYQILYTWDEDFKKIFKVLADFDSVMTNTTRNVSCFVSLMSKICEEEGLLPFDRQGIIAVLEQSVRSAGKKNKLSTRFSDVADLMREASFWATKESAGTVGRGDVERAVREKVFRDNLPEEKIKELVAEGILLIDSDGAKTGQVNGLSVYHLGYYAFGQPARITAEVSVGNTGVINIEREAGMSGRTHDKGVYIMSSFLRSRYTKNKPLSMNASICFEQSYGGVDGDSASSTELYALLSALSGLPIRQDLAVTGSVNQKGQIQPIGGVNEKIEGFFEICAARGLSGSQGVLIPAQNVDELMLRENVAEAIRLGNFHLYAVHTVDQGIELLTGVPAGEPDEAGNWPEGTVNGLANRRLQEFADTLRQYRTD